MRLNADFARRAVVHAGSTPWVPSPMRGVDRRMLDRVGGEVARATSVVRYAPESHFKEHEHGGGEEFLVLSGRFSDASGDYGEGCYIRNAPTSKHAPWSVGGCVILVKLHQFEQTDRTHVVLDAAKMQGFPAADRPHVRVVPLFQDEHENVRIEFWPSGAPVVLPVSQGGEFFVVEGSFSESGEELSKWSWLRLPAHGELEATAGPEGAKVWVKTGHLTGAHPGMQMERYEGL